MDEYKYGATAVGHVVTNSGNRGFEICNSNNNNNSVSQVTSQLINNGVIAGGVNLTPNTATAAPISIPITTTTSSPLAVHKQQHKHQQQQQALKDDLYSHNQFNYHHANIITQKLPNIEYFNYMESPPNVVNGMSAMSSSGMGGPNGIATIDLTREAATVFVRNSERISSKVPAKISNFNF